MLEIDLFKIVWFNRRCQFQLLFGYEYSVPEKYFGPKTQILSAQNLFLTLWPQKDYLDHYRCLRRTGRLRNRSEWGCAEVYSPFDATSSIKVRQKSEGSDIKIQNVRAAGPSRYNAPCLQLGGATKLLNNAIRNTFELQR